LYWSFGNLLGSKPHKCIKLTTRDEQLCMPSPPPEISHLGREERSDNPLDWFPVTQVRETRASGIGTIAWIVSGHPAKWVELRNFPWVAKATAESHRCDPLQPRVMVHKEEEEPPHITHRPQVLAHLPATKDVLVWLENTIVYTPA